ncbi:MAG: hypothetical protein NTV11_18575 [Rhodocyclales bacterium]|nr:hypothetical protein [Rhodocyclales bacterium]
MSRKQSFIAAVVAIAMVGTTAVNSAYADTAKYPSVDKTSADSAKQYKMSKEFVDQVSKLPPEFVAQFKKMTSKHTRFSEDATARQVMMELLSDTQCVTTMLMVENGEMAADCAIRASAHRWPKGHLLAYVQLNQINADSLGALPGINELVERGLERVAEFAIKKDFISAGAEMGNVLKGCATCHSMFRFDKGTSPYIRE